MSELYFETKNKSLMENLKQCYGGEMIDSDSLVASILWRFNGSESHSSFFSIENCVYNLKLNCLWKF
jgi:hypothetical protein